MERYVIVSGVEAKDLGLVEAPIRALDAHHAETAVSRGKLDDQGVEAGSGFEGLQYDVRAQGHGAHIERVPADGADLDACDVRGAGVEAV